MKRLLIFFNSSFYYLNILQRYITDLICGTSMFERQSKSRTENTILRIVLNSIFLKRNIS